MPIIRNLDDVDELNGLAPRSCELCHGKEHVMRCSACQAVFYCSKACQTVDREDHKMPCKVIKKARLLYESEYEKLRDKPGDVFTPERVFETAVGHFWGILDTRPYMRARYGFVDALLLSYGTAGGPVDVVQTALNHLLDMLRLCRSDNMGVRDLIPALYIRLGRDQEAYDFVKWYATSGQDPEYDWGDMELPFLDVKDADLLEEPHENFLNEKWMSSLSHTVALMLLKVRVLLDLQAVQNASVALCGAVPQEVVDLVRNQLVGSVIRARRDLLLAEPEETTRLVESLKCQIQQLHRVVKGYNPHFWNLLVEDPDVGVLNRPNQYSTRSSEEAILVIGYSSAAWYETPGAVDVLRKLTKPTPMNHFHL
ncbi:hypothetical protein CDD83_7326 [Cordyceps sp. RAO-2017]|nr:hypothetical protein CDD83_7326 [Cordyceps sp. RAO-2017]